MIEEMALVISIDGSYAEIRTEEKSACGSCEARNGCATAAVSEAMEKPPTLLRALNPIGARPGEKVVVGIEEAALNTVSMFFYAVPLAGLIIFALLGQFIAQWTGSDAGEPLSALGGVLGLVLGFVLLRRFIARVGDDQHYQVTVLRRADSPSVTFCAK
jgi:sigma-E factor negative regulatory protein RseC